VSRDNTIRLWQCGGDRRTFTVKAKLPFDCRVDAVAWSPEGFEQGPLVLTGSQDKMVRIWQAEGDDSNWRVVAQLGPHPDGVTSVSWSTEGYRIAVGAADSSTTVWHRRGTSISAWEQVDLRLASVPRRPLSSRR